MFINGRIRYILLQPLLRIFTKAPTSAIQSVLHALFLPTPFKLHQSDVGVGSDSTTGKPSARRNRLVAGEILKPGALYSDCSVIEVKLPRVATAGGQIGEGKDIISILSKLYRLYCDLDSLTPPQLRRT